MQPLTHSSPREAFSEDDDPDKWPQIPFGARLAITPAENPSSNLELEDEGARDRYEGCVFWYRSFEDAAREDPPGVVIEMGGAVILVCRHVCFRPYKCYRFVWIADGSAFPSIKSPSS